MTKRKPKEDWKPISTFAHGGGFNCLLWWRDDYALVWPIEGHWETDGGDRPFESEEQPTHWALVIPPPFDVLVRFVGEIRSELGLPIVPD